MKCPVCRRARCQWKDVDPKRATTERIKQIIDHNISYIDMVSQGATSSHAEERLYLRLTRYEEELERREE